MKIIADLHTHTNVSHHALSSFEEMIEGAVRANHIALAITNHGHAINDGANSWHFGAFRTIPRLIRGVQIIAGAEANILTDGTIDISEKHLKMLDYVVASIHKECFLSKDYDDITNAYLKILENPYINALGHIGTPAFKFDYEKVISKCNEHKKIIELNNSSYGHRVGSYENCKEIALLCKKYSVPLALTSDAHISYSVGEVSTSIKIVEEIDYPKELLINISRENLEKYFKEYCGIEIFDRK